MVHPFGRMPWYARGTYHLARHVLRPRVGPRFVYRPRISTAVGAAAAAGLYQNRRRVQFSGPSTPARNVRPRTTSYHPPTPGNMGMLIDSSLPANGISEAEA